MTTRNCTRSWPTASPRRLSEGQVDVPARHVLLVKLRLGLFDDPYVDEAEV